LEIPVPAQFAACSVCCRKATWELADGSKCLVNATEKETGHSGQRLIRFNSHAAEQTELSDSKKMGSKNKFVRFCPEFFHVFARTRNSPVVKAGICENNDSP
jgi:hypothetical protein